MGSAGQGESMEGIGRRGHRGGAELAKGTEVRGVTSQRSLGRYPGGSGAHGGVSKPRNMTLGFEFQEVAALASPGKN